MNTTRGTRLAALAALFCCCARLQAQGSHIGMGTPAQARTIIAARSRNALMALQTNNTVWLSQYVQPSRRVRFSPYVFVQPGQRELSRMAVRGLRNNPAPYWWGRFDGSGEPIKLRWNAYRSRFVCDRDYRVAPQVLYNTLIARGNTVNNLSASYPGAIFVEYHYPATGGGMNWSSLWLIWQKSGGRWYLSGVAHDQWTI